MGEGCQEPTETTGDWSAFEGEEFLAHHWRMTIIADLVGLPSGASQVKTFRDGDGSEGVRYFVVQNIIQTSLS